MEELALLERIADEVNRVVANTPFDAFGHNEGPGADGAPTTRIDRLAEERILEVLAETEAPLNVCTEETGWIDKGADATLIVDPIDGTTNAVRGIPFYCVSLAIAQTGLDDVRTGLVRNLPTGDTYTAQKDEGASLNGGPLSSRSYDPDDVIHSPITGPKTARHVVDELGGATDVRGMGAAALEMALVAQGALDVFINTKADLHIMDIAAGKLILEESGGAIATLHGDPPALPFDPQASTDLIAVGDPNLLARIGAAR